MRLRLVLMSLLLCGCVVGVGRAQPISSVDTTVQDRRPIPYLLTPGPGFEQALKEGTRTPSGEPGPNYWTNTAEYDLEATVRPNSNMLHGTGRIQYHNNSPDTLRQLVLHLRQNIHKKGTLRNRPAEITGGMTIDRVDLGGADSLQRVQSRRQLKQLEQGYILQDTRMVLVLPEPLAPEETATVNVDWHFRILGADNFRMGQDGEVYYLGYWYPQMAVYDDVNGWRAQPYQGDGEFYMGYGSYDVSVTVPEGWLVGATGTLQNPDAVLTDSIRARLDRARDTSEVVSIVGADDRGAGGATAEAADDSTLTWRFSAEQVRDFAFGTSDAFVWDATSAETGEGTAMIHALYRPDRSAWDRSAEFAQFSIEHLSDMIVPYPYPQMTTVEGPIGGGMEYPMITLIGSGRSTESLFGVTYHEISHMWFPMMVGTDEKAYAWLDEGTTTFNETEGKNEFFPDQKAWAQGNHYYFRFAPSIDVPSMRHADRYPVDGPDRYVASYDKPGVMLRALRGVLGEETFFEAYRTYAEQWAYKHPTPHDFFNTFEDVAGRELDWFWRSAFYENWTLDQAVQDVERTDEGVVVTIADLSTFPMPVRLKAEYADGRTVERTVGVTPWLEGKREIEVTLAPGTVTRVTIDPDETFPDLDRTNNVWTASE